MAPDDWRTRLRERLAETSERSPRPVVPLDLPFEARHLLDSAKIARLRPAAVLVPVVDHGDEPRILLTVRTQQMRNHAGQISFPGGSTDASDSGPSDTALRESAEEIALERDHVRVMGYLDDYPTVTGFRVTPVVAVVDPRASARADGIEVEEVFDVPLTFVLDPDNYQRGYLEREGMKLPYWGLTYGERFIWGATAGMLRDLMLKLRVGR